MRASYMGLFDTHCHFRKLANKASDGHLFYFRFVSTLFYGVACKVTHLNKAVLWQLVQVLGKVFTPASCRKNYRISTHSSCNIKALPYGGSKRRSRVWQD